MLQIPLLFFQTVHSVIQKQPPFFGKAIFAGQQRLRDLVFLFPQPVVYRQQLQRNKNIGVLGQAVDQRVPESVSRLKGGQLLIPTQLFQSVKTVVLQHRLQQGSVKEPLPQCNCGCVIAVDHRRIQRRIQILS